MSSWLGCVGVVVLRGSGGGDVPWVDPLPVEPRLQEVLPKQLQPCHLQCSPNSVLPKPTHQCVTLRSSGDTKTDPLRKKKDKGCALPETEGIKSLVLEPGYLTFLKLHR